MQRRDGTAFGSAGRARAALALALTALAALALAGPAGARSVHRPPRVSSTVLLVGFRPGVAPARQAAIERTAGALHVRRLLPVGRLGKRGVRGPAMATLHVRRGRMAAILRRLRHDRAVRYAEPDQLMHESATPNDPSFSLQWGDLNTGQLVNGASGLAGADDRATTAWSTATGTRSIVIGETDTGVDYRHPDLAANVWSNPGGIGGCAAGTHGYNVLTAVCDPMDDDTSYGGHGTHVAGILGAVGNNGTGVAGMNWQTTILPVKWLDSSGNGYTSGLISALDWILAAKQAGVNVRVVNDSATFVGTAYSQALSDEIDKLGANGILFVTAAGNTGDDNDNLSVRRYPCGYDRPTEICVTAGDQTDHLPSWANYGAQTVDLAAPGVNIYSTLRNGAYGFISGGSMASPQVAGTAALVLSRQDMTPTALKADILNNVRPLPQLSGLVRTGGVLDVCAALPGCSAPPPPPATATFGTTTVGGNADTFLADRKRVNRATLTTAGSVTKLSIYLAPTGVSGQQTIKGVIYADAGGTPGARLGVSNELTFHSTQTAGWYDLTLPQPLQLAAGTYWIGIITGASSNVIGFRWASVSGSRAYNTNTYTSGPTDPFGPATIDGEQMSVYATYTPGGTAPAPTPPVLQTAPTISGTPQVGQTLSASPGTWSGSPTSYAYAWQRCSTSGSSCTAISGATGATYTLASADAGSTLRVSVTASNSAGASSPALSSPTAVVAAASTTATFGTTTVGSNSDWFLADRKRVEHASLPTTGTVSKLSIYMQPTGVSGQQTIKGLIYADSGGVPGARLAVSNEVTFHSTQTAGWYDLTLPQPVSLAAGTYWIGIITGATSDVIGFRYATVSGSRAYNANTYTSGPTDPFGPATIDSEQMSLYATYTTG